jgi:hypothetical protein
MKKNYKELKISTSVECNLPFCETDEAPVHYTAGSVRKIHFSFLLHFSFLFQDFKNLSGLPPTEHILS